MEEELRQIEQAKDESLVQVLFKVGRLLNEQAIERMNRARPGGPRVRPAHTSLFPHIDFDGTRLTELAERSGVSKQAVFKLVDDLEEMGLVERLPDPRDARAKLVCYSASGRKQILGGLKLLAQLQEELQEVVGARKLKALHQTLLQILQHLES